MDLRNLRESSTAEVMNHLIDIIPDMTCSQVEALNEHLDSYFDRDLFFYQKHKPTPPSLWLRLSWPLLVILILLLAISIPIRYVITGQGKYNQGAIMRFTEKWLNALGG